MVTQQVLLVAAAVTALAGGGTYAGYHLIEDDATCGDMEAMHGMMGGSMHGMDHDAMQDDMDEMHEECHAMMDHHDHNTTADSAPTHRT